MKRRIFAFVLAMVLCCSMSITVFAGSASQTGPTKGGTEGFVNVTGKLTVNKYTAQATTTCKVDGVLVFQTTVRYTYLNGYGHSETDSAVGTGSATIGNSLGLGQSAESQHSALGGSTLGSWSCSLYAGA